MIIHTRTKLTPIVLKLWRSLALVLVGSESSDMDMLDSLTKAKISTELNPPCTLYSTFFLFSNSTVVNSQGRKNSEREREREIRAKQERARRRSRPY
jgi:hypothetical protein